MYLQSEQSRSTVLQVSLYFEVLVLGSLSWPQGLNTLQLKKMYANRKTEQIMKMSSSVSQLICSKSTQCNKIQKNATTTDRDCQGGEKSDLILFPNTDESTNTSHVYLSCMCMLLCSVGNTVYLTYVLSSLNQFMFNKMESYYLRLECGVH